jgi:hypothetical protein
MSIEDRLRRGLASEVSRDGVEQALEATLRRRRTTIRRRVLGGVVLATSVAAISPWAVHQWNSEGADPVTTTPEPSNAIEGSWVSHLTRRQVVDQIKAAGLEEWVKPFLAHEQIRKHQTLVYSFTDDSFKVADYGQGGGWHVGWEGSLRVLPGHQLSLHDDFSGATDIYHWRVDGNKLHFTRVSSEAALVYDIPYQVYDAAYMGDWWERTDCPMRTGQDC